MTTATLTLTEFLLARIAEDEGCVREEELHTHLCVYNGADWMCDCNLRARVLAECEAKRKIVGLHEEDQCDDPRGGTESGCSVCSETNYVDGGRYSSGWPCDTLGALATIYVDHQDYRDEWRA